MDLAQLIMAQPVSTTARGAAEGIRKPNGESVAVRTLDRLIRSIAAINAMLGLLSAFALFLSQALANR